ncbi:transposase [Sorangium sp. So ce117]|uniref:transposase n=1 Tax=Sorangium sp. So ce117 TaxID=3133277 RepID=UPI003F644F6C
MRQWVLSVPFDLRALVATKPDVRTAVGRIFAEEIARAKKRLSNVARKGKDDDEPFADKPSRFAASYDGFDVHCAVRIAVNDDAGRERLLRYCARPPFATGRIEVLKDGRVAYLMKTARRGSTHRVMTPIELMARLAALVPPPFYPTITYHRVFAARSTWRPLGTPKPPAGGSRPAKKTRSWPTSGCRPRRPRAPLRVTQPTGR